MTTATLDLVPAELFSKREELTFSCSNADSIAPPVSVAVLVMMWHPENAVAEAAADSSLFPVPNVATAPPMPAEFD